MFLRVQKQFIHASAISAGEKRSDFTAVYASPRATSHSVLWGDLNKVEVGGVLGNSWGFQLCIKEEEWSSGGGALTTFANWAEVRGLIDLGFTGPKFTWNHGANVETRRSARLD